MTSYKHNLKVISDNYNIRIGFQNDKLIVDNRYFLGLRTSYNIEIIRNIIENSFDKYLNIFELTNIFNEEESSDNEIDNISFNNFKLLEYEHLIECALKGLLFMTSSSYYLEPEQAIFLIIYNKYNLLYNNLKKIRLEPSLNSYDYSNNYSSDTDSLNISIQDNQDNQDNQDTNRPSCPISIEISEASEASEASENSYINEEQIDEISAYSCVVPNDSDTNIVINPMYNVAFYNPDVFIDDDNEDDIVYDKYNHYDRTRCNLFKKISQFCSAIKRTVHNAYKSFISLFY